MGTDTFDVALVDQYLEGGETGLELVGRLREAGGAFPVVMVSGYADATLARAALSLGIFDLIDKADLSPALLDRAIRYAIRDWRTERYLIEAGWQAPRGQEGPTPADEE